MTQPFLSITETQDPATTDPLGNFYAGIKSEETKTTYRKTLREFLFAIKEFSGDFNQRAIAFCKYTKENPDNTKNLLKNYAKYLRTRTEKPISDENYLKPTVVPNKFKGIKKFLKMNELPMEWGGIEAIFPEITNVQQTRGYTTEEIRKIIEYCSTPLSKFLILAESSSGIRVGSLYDQTWGNINPIYPAKNGTYTHDPEKATGNVVCASIIVYDGTSSRYPSLISLEAWDQLRIAKNNRHQFRIQCL
ncbi:hypothetical protein [Nitrosopumilus sp.]|uniref:hypothetical protein n=1 Tax=Nitrosopumilus sp. TaxID=2024843 RepID=UPI00247CECFE|nr:hypothetical protein [Nitrosopumilus sp.]MCV0410518.1 hypothetical protein [Nitrosopumilus sp.]